MPVANLEDPFGELADIKDEWIITKCLDIEIQKSDGTTRKGVSYDIQAGDFVEAEVKLDVQLTKGRDGAKQARVKLAMTRVMRLKQAKDLPSKTVKTEGHGLTTIAASSATMPTS